MHFFVLLIACLQTFLIILLSLFTFAFILLCQSILSEKMSEMIFFNQESVLDVNISVISFFVESRFESVSAQIATMNVAFTDFAKKVSSISAEKFALLKQDISSMTFVMNF